MVGTLIEYDYASGADGPTLTRTTRLLGAPNDGPAKVSHIQTQLGRRPVFAAGNTDRGPGDAALGRHAPTARPWPSSSTTTTPIASSTIPAPGSPTRRAEPIVDVGHRLGWTVVSMAEDWATVFGPDDP